MNNQKDLVKVTIHLHGTVVNFLTNIVDAKKVGETYFNLMKEYCQGGRYLVGGWQVHPNIIINLNSISGIEVGPPESTYEKNQKEIAEAVKAQLKLLKKDIGDDESWRESLEE